MSGGKDWDSIWGDDPRYQGSDGWDRWLSENQQRCPDDYDWPNIEERTSFLELLEQTKLAIQVDQCFDSFGDTALISRASIIDSFSKNLLTFDIKSVLLELSIEDLVEAVSNMQRLSFSVQLFNQDCAIYSQQLSECLEFLYINMRLNISEPGNAKPSELIVMAFLALVSGEPSLGEFVYFELKPFLKTNVASSSLVDLLGMLKLEFPTSEESLKLHEAACAKLAIAKRSPTKRLWNNLGHLYFSGKGVPKDAVIALNHFLLSASSLSAVGMRNIALCCEKGNGISTDYELALEWLEIGCELKDPDCMIRAAKILEGGVLPDSYIDLPERAFSKILRAANLNYKDAYLKVARKYLYGEGVVSNISDAIYWLEKSAGEGVSDAMFELGSLLLDNDELQAVKWFEKASSMGHPEATYALANILVNESSPLFDFDKAVELYSSNKTHIPSLVKSLHYLELHHIERRESLKFTRAVGYLKQQDKIKKAVESYSSNNTQIPSLVKSLQYSDFQNLERKDSFILRNALKYITQQTIKEGDETAKAFDRYLETIGSTGSEMPEIEQIRCSYARGYALGHELICSRYLALSYLLCESHPEESVVVEWCLKAVEAGDPEIPLLLALYLGNDEQKHKKYGYSFLDLLSFSVERESADGCLLFGELFCMHDDNRTGLKFLQKANELRSDYSQVAVNLATIRLVKNENNSEHIEAAREAVQKLKQLPHEVIVPQFLSKYRRGDDPFIHKSNIDNSTSQILLALDCIEQGEEWRLELIIKASKLKSMNLKLVWASVYISRFCPDINSGHKKRFISGPLAKNGGYSPSSDFTFGFTNHVKSLAAGIGMFGLIGLIVVLVVLFSSIISTVGFFIIRLISGISDGFLNDIWMVTPYSIYVFGGFFGVITVIVIIVMLAQYVTRTGEFKDCPYRKDVIENMKAELSPYSIINYETEKWFNSCKHIFNKYPSIRDHLKHQALQFNESDLSKYRDRHFESVNN